MKSQEAELTIYDPCGIIIDQVLCLSIAEAKQYASDNYYDDETAMIVTSDGKQITGQQSLSVSNSNYFWKWIKEN